MVEKMEMNDDNFFKQKHDLKIVLCGDTAVGKSKILERFLLKDYVEITNSTHALIIYKHKHIMQDGKEIIIDFWDTAGQTKFDNLHESYFFEAHGAIIVFDTTRVITYKNSINWYNKFRSSCSLVPCIAVGNKIDMDSISTERAYPLVEKMNCILYLTSAANGTNVVALFKDIIEKSLTYKNGPDKSYLDKMLDVLGDDKLFETIKEV
mmetsp:Transcript_29355/g.30466  ORF Transcript_29355/g.30466 Transcript_29355/m.30466 type:complete len:208 (+) Transcript_29355:3-626(+)